MAVSRDEASVAVAPSHPRLVCIVIVLAAIYFTGTSSYKADLHPNSLQEMLPQNEDIILEEDADSVSYVDVCEMYSGFERLTTGLNPDSEMVQLHPSTWVYVTKCRHSGRSCKGYGGGRSVCRVKKAWVQVYGRLDEGGTWQPHWIEVDSSCACALRLFPFLAKHPVN